ncbi:PAS domain S-box protein [Streptomyces sp. NPDC001530]|uniref:PAS domain S-box protein n=1 Tax=Streptomyces sp. NPDC001530 TaxID=3364582 RepID=UPI0036ADFF1F
MEDLDPEVVLGMAAQAPDGIVIIDSEGLIRYWNRGAERIFGFSAADVAGRSLDVIIPEKHRQRHWDGFRTAMDRGATKYGEADLLTVPAVAADGGTLSIEFSVVLLTGPDGDAHVGAVIRDVTARRAREREMMRRRAEAAADRTAV